MLNPSPPISFIIQSTSTVVCGISRVVQYSTCTTVCGNPGSPSDCSFTVGPFITSCQTWTGHLNNPHLSVCICKMETSTFLSGLLRGFSEGIKVKVMCFPNCTEAPQGASVNSQVALWVFQEKHSDIISHGANCNFSCLYLLMVYGLPW